MAKEPFICPICGKEEKYGYELTDGKICSECQEIAEPFLLGMDGGDEYDPSEMTVEIIGKYVKGKRGEVQADLDSVPKLPQWNSKLEKPPYCPICGEKFKLLNMSMQILDTYICITCFNKAEKYEIHKRCFHGTDDIKFHTLEQFRREVEAVDFSDSQTNCAMCGAEIEKESDYLWLADDSRICRNCVNKARSEYPIVTVREKKWFRTTEYNSYSQEDQGTYLEWTNDEERRDPIADLTLAEFKDAIGSVSASQEPTANDSQSASAEVYRTLPLFKNAGDLHKPKYTGQKNMFLLYCRMLSGSFTVGSKFKVVHGYRTFDYTVGGLLEWNGYHIHGEGRDLQKVEAGMMFAMLVGAQKIMIFPSDTLTTE